MMALVFDWVEKMVGKIENHFYQQFIFFFFSPPWFQGLLKKSGLRGKGYVLSKASPCFYVSAVQVFWHHGGKMDNFSFSHSVFYPSGELSTDYKKFKIVICKLIEFGRV